MQVVGLTSVPVPTVQLTAALLFGLVGVLNVGAAGSVRSSWYERLPSAPVLPAMSVARACSV